MAETIILDPHAFDPTRTQLEITQWVSAAAGINWGDALIDAYMADMAVGSSPIDYRLPNRTITIPLILTGAGGLSFTDNRSRLQMKIGLLQRAGGVLQRQIDGTNLYADIENATLHLGGSWLQAYGSADVDAVLTLETLPEFYGDEITLDPVNATGVLTGPLLQGGLNAQILGDLPGRVRIVVTDTSEHDQLGAFWGFRGLHYDDNGTAALTYEAVHLTALNGAVSASVEGATALQITPPTGAWTPMVTTNLATGNLPLTHQGTYRVWARCYSANQATFRLQWGVGSLSTPETNAAVVLPAFRSGVSDWYLLDLGTVRVDPIAAGVTQWFGVIQAYVLTAGASAAVKTIYLQPLDETAGKLAYLPTPSPTIISTAPTGNNPAAGGNVGATAANDTLTGAVDWAVLGITGSLNSVVGTLNNRYAGATLTTGQVSHWLKVTGFGFAIPAGATITGIQAITYTNRVGSGQRPDITWTVSLVKAGTIQTGAMPTGLQATTPYGSDIALISGSPTDLWGATPWGPADINDAGFGVAIQATLNSAHTIDALVNYVSIIVYYTLATGFGVANDAVIYADRSAEWRTEGMFRTDPTGAVYGQESNVIGNLPRIPPTGLEARPVELMMKLSRGDLVTLEDPYDDTFTVQVIYRPSYLYASPAYVLFPSQVLFPDEDLYPGIGR